MIYPVRDVPRGEIVGQVRAVTLRWWKGYCTDKAHEPVSADTRSKAAEELRRHVRAAHWRTAFATGSVTHVSHVGGHFYRTDLTHSSPAPSREQDRPSRRSLAGTPSSPASGRLPERLG